LSGQVRSGHYEEREKYIQRFVIKSGTVNEVNHNGVSDIIKLTQFATFGRIVVERLYQFALYIYYIYYNATIVTSEFTKIEN